MAGKDEIPYSKGFDTNQNISEDTTEVDSQKLPKEMAGETGTADANTLVPNDGQSLPQTERSNDAFCTSSDDVLNAFNFEDDQETFGYEQVNSRNTEDSPKVVLVCGDLFRNVCKNVNSLASILLELQNKVLLKNFLEEFHGGQTSVPWVVSASLKHWASKLSLDEDSESESRKLPYLKTSQALTGKGEVDDPKALNRLEERVAEYLKRLDGEGPFNDAVESFGFVVNYICDTIDPIGPGDDLAGTSFTTPNNIDNNNRRNALVEAEVELEEVQKPEEDEPAPPVREPSENEFLHRIAGFGSFMGIADQRGSETAIPPSTLLTKSQQSIFPFVFPSKSGLLSGAFSTPLKLTTINSQTLLESKVSLTLLASTSSRHGFQVNRQDNGNPLTTITAETDEDEEDVDFPTSGASAGYSSRTGEDIADDIVRHIWNEDHLLVTNRTEENQPDSAGIVSHPPPLPAVGNDPETQADPKEGFEKGAQKSPPVKQAKLEPVKAGSSTSKGVAKGTGTNNNKVQNQGRAQSPYSSNAASKKIVATPAKATGKVGIPVLTPKARAPPKPSTGIAFGVKVDPKPRKPLISSAGKPGPNPAGTSKKPARGAPATVPRKVEYSNVATGPRRIEFTKVAQTVSYRQLNKENLELLQAPVGQGAGAPSFPTIGENSGVNTPPPCLTNPETGNPVSAISLALAGATLVDTTNGNLPFVELHMAPASISNLTPGGFTTPGNTKVFSSTSTPSSSNSSRIPSFTQMKPSSGAAKSKTSLGYVGLARHKKCLQEAMVNNVQATPSTPLPRCATLKVRQGSDGAGGSGTPRPFQ